MRYDADHKQRTRERILTATAKAIRALGPDRLGVAAVMRSAGLTHGGFYSHFASREVLLAAGIDRMFAEALSSWNRWTHDRSAADGLLSYIDWYLSAAHRDARRTGCPIAALATDLPRLSRRCRAAFATGVGVLTDAIALRLSEVGHKDSGDLARSILSELVGALSLARAEPEPAVSDSVLDASRRSIKRRIALGECA